VGARPSAVTRRPPSTAPPISRFTTFSSPLPNPPNPQRHVRLPRQLDGPVPLAPIAIPRIGANNELAAHRRDGHPPRVQHFHVEPRSARKPRPRQLDHPIRPPPPPELNHAIPPPPS